jgi:hypothetical protein
MPTVLSTAGAERVTTKNTILRRATRNVSDGASTWTLRA